MEHDKLKISLVQRAAGADITKNIEQGLNDVRTAAEAGANLIAFAELAFWPFFPQWEKCPDAESWAEEIPGPTTDRFAALAAELGVVIILNLYERAADRFFDSSPVIDSEGRILGVTRMAHIIEAPCYHETHYYHPGDAGAQVYETSVGRVGVAICYDRHFPEYMRALGLGGADLVVVPQAGAKDEWPAGLFEGEMQTAGLQNGYFTALCNRTGPEEHLIFAGESFVTDPLGGIVAQIPASDEEGILYADLDLEMLTDCPARRHYLPDRRPEIYPKM